MSTLLTTSPLKPTHQHRKWSDGVLLVVALLALWQVSSLLLGADVLPGPWSTFARLNAIFHDEDFPENLRVTSTAFALGFAISCIGGVCLGLVLGVRRLAGDVIEPILMAFRYQRDGLATSPLYHRLLGVVTDDAEVVTVRRSGGKSCAKPCASFAPPTPPTRTTIFFDSIASATAHSFLRDGAFSRAFQRDTPA